MRIRESCRVLTRGGIENWPNEVTRRSCQAGLDSLDCAAGVGGWSLAHPISAACKGVVVGGDPTAHGGVGGPEPVFVNEQGGNSA